MTINEEARKKLLNEVNGLTDDELNWKPADDQWSVRQVLEHLYLMEGGISKTIQDQLKNGDSHPTADKPIERSVDRSTKVEAPDFAVPSDSFATLDELKEKLAASHQMLLHIADTVPAEKLADKSYPHPAFGDMSLAQYIPFTGYHEMRHIEQIQEVKKAMRNRK